MNNNILHAIDVAETGGAETVFIQLIGNLDRTKFTPIVVLPSKGWIYEQLTKLDIKPIIINMEGTLNTQYLRSLIRIIRKNNIKLIHSHLFGSNIYCSIAGLITRTPVVSTFHGSIDVAEDEKFLFAKRTLLKLGTKKVVFVSHYLKQILTKRLKLNKNICAVVYNGIKSENYQQKASVDYREVLKINNDSKFISLVGNVNHAKAYDVLIRTAAKLKDDNFTFVIAGDTSDPIFSELKSLIKENNLSDTVKFIGFIDNINDFIKSSDIYLLCSRDEGFSISTLEAMASNVPVIATKSGGPEEIITHNLNGILVDNENPSAISKNLLQLSRETKVRNHLVQNAEKLVESTFSLKKTIIDYESIYNTLLK